MALMTPANTYTPKPLLEIVRSQRDLLVHPVKWYLRHLEMVGCRFDDVETPTRSESTHQDHGDTDRRHSNDAEGLARNLSPEVKRRCLHKILLGEEGKFACAR
jgi:hypothetical protein